MRALGSRMGCNEVPIEAFAREQALGFVSGITHDDGVIGTMREERIHASLGFDDQCPRLIQGVETLTGPAERLRYTSSRRASITAITVAPASRPIGHGMVGLNFQTVDGDERDALGVADAFGG